MSTQISNAILKRNRLAKSISSCYKFENMKSGIIFASQQKPTTFSSGIIPVINQPYNSTLVHDLLGFTNERLIEPELTLLMKIDKDLSTDCLIARKSQNAEQILWDGENISNQLIKSNSGIEKYSDFKSEQALRDIFHKFSGNKIEDYEILVDNETLPFISPKLKGLKLKNANAAISLANLYKSEFDLKNFAKSNKIASNALIDTMLHAKQAKAEFDLENLFQSKCMAKGASRLAFPPVVASGKNATSIHHLRNSSELKQGDLILMDAGCIFNGMNSDISRTWPISGKFTEAQRLIYDIVYSVQKQCFDIIKLFESSKITLDDLLHHTIMTIGKEMCSKGVIENPDGSYESFQKIGSKYCPHHVSHFIGTKLHDCPHLHEIEDFDQSLRNSMCFTVEPGIYINEHDLDVKEEFRGIGIRIEDCVALIDGKLEILSELCPSCPDKIEKLLEK